MADPHISIVSRPPGPPWDHSSRPFSLCSFATLPLPPPPLLWVVMSLWGCGPFFYEWILIMLSGHSVLEASSCHGRASLPLHKLKCWTFALQASLTARVPQPATVTKWQTPQNPRTCLSMGDGGSSLLWLPEGAGQEPGPAGQVGVSKPRERAVVASSESAASKHAQAPQRVSGVQTPLISALSAHISLKRSYCFELFHFYCIGRP